MSDETEAVPRETVVCPWCKGAGYVEGIFGGEEGETGVCLLCDTRGRVTPERAAADEPDWDRLARGEPSDD